MISDLEHAKNQVAYFRTHCGVQKIGSAFHAHLTEERERWERILLALDDSELLDTVQTRGLLITPPFDASDTWLVEDVRVPEHESYTGADVRAVIREARAGQAPR